MPRPHNVSVAQNMRRLAFSIYLPTFLNAIARNAALLALPLYALEAEGGAVLAAAIFGLRSGGTLASDVPSGQLIAKFGDKAVMLGGLGILAVMAFIPVFSGSPVSLALVAFGVGVGGGSWILGRLAHVTETIRLEQRGRVISVLAGLERAGLIVGPFLAGATASLFGYEPVFIVIGLLTLISLGLVARLTVRTETKQVHRPQVELRQLLAKHIRVFMSPGMVMVCLSFLRSTRQMLIPVWGSLIGLSPAEIGLVASLAATVDLLMFYPVGLILDHIGRRAALVPAMTLMSIAILLTPWTSTFLTFLAISLLAGLGNGFGTGIFMTLGGDFAPRYGRAQFLGMWRLVGDSGGTAGPFVVGAIAESFTHLLACSVTGIFGVAGAILAIRFIPEPRKRQTP